MLPIQLGHFLDAVGDLSFWLFICSTLAIIFGFLAQGEKRRRLWGTFSLIFLVLNAFLAFRLSRSQDTQQIEREKERSRHAEESRTKAEELAKKSDELSKKSDEIARLNREITSKVTGGDSYGFFGFLIGDGTVKNPTPIFMHVGKYPLYDVVLYVTDYEKFKLLVPLPPGQMLWADTEESFKELETIDNETRMQIEVGTIPPGRSTRFKPTWKLPDRDKVTYSIQIQSRFQTFYENLKLHRISGRWKQAFRVHIYDATGKLVVLKESVPKDFPRDEKGESFWRYK